MVQSVELLLDEPTDAAVTEQWLLLVAAGLPSQARHTGASNRPHVTLSARDAVPAAVEPLLGAAVGPLPLPLVLGGLLCFPGKRCVLARLVVPSVDLLRAHRDVGALLDAAGAPPPRGHHLAAGRWTPHVTLARGLAVEQVAAAMALLVPGSSDRETAAVAARRWDGDARRAWVLPPR